MHLLRLLIAIGLVSIALVAPASVLGRQRSRTQ